MSILPEKAKVTSSNFPSPAASQCSSDSNHGGHDDNQLVPQFDDLSLRIHTDTPSSGSLEEPVAPDTITTIPSANKVNGAGTTSTGKTTKTSGRNTGTSFHGEHARSGGAGSSRYRKKQESTSNHGPQSFGNIDNSNSTSTNTSGRRTQLANGNHLLNFQYAPIARPRPKAPPPRRPQRKIKPYNKDLFLQANYKFVLLDWGNDMPDLMMDPDKMIPWEDIICVKYSTTSPVQCPICLEQPICPQITSCGHIYCFPCILQYLLMGKEDQHGESWKRCPLCFVMISPKDLYTIYIESVEQYISGDTIEFMLLTRRKDSLSISLKNPQVENVTECSAYKSVDFFSKFTLTADVDLSVRQAISDLDSWLVRADSGLVDDIEKLPYVCAAMEHLEQRNKYWKLDRGANGDKTCQDTESGAVSQMSRSFSSAAYRRPDVGLFEQTEHQTDTPLKSKTSQVEYDVSLTKALPVHSSILPDSGERDAYHFYQAVDGQHLILHPLNMKCLLHHYGNYDMLPNRISGRILQLETVTQTEEMRRRYRYLSHFSLTTTFQLCEIDLSKMLPPGSLTPFADEIMKRENQRKQVARKEQKEKVKAEAALSEYYVPGQSSFMLSSYNNPPFSLDDFEALGSCLVTSSSPPQVGESPDAKRKLLFSNVTKLGYAAGTDCPTLIRQGPEATSWSPKTSGPGNGSAMSFASVVSTERSIENVACLKVNEVGKKGKKASRVLLSTSQGGRY